VFVSAEPPVIVAPPIVASIPITSPGSPGRSLNSSTVAVQQTVPVAVVHAPNPKFEQQHPASEMVTSGDDFEAVRQEARRRAGCFYSFLLF